MGIRPVIIQTFDREKYTMDWTMLLYGAGGLTILVILFGITVRRYGIRRTLMNLALAALWPVAFVYHSLRQWYRDAARVINRFGAWLRENPPDVPYWIIVLGIAAGLHWLVVEYVWDDVFTFMVDGTEQPFKWGHILMAALWAYALSSWIIIQPTKVASQRFLGIPIRHLKAGPAFVPRWICTHKIFLGTAQQRELPGEPQDLFHQDGEQEIPAGKVPPLRVTFAQDLSPAADRDPLNRRVTARVSFTITWHIIHAHRFERVIGNGGEDGIDAIEEANKQLSDTGIRFLTDYFSRQTVSAALQTKEAATAHLGREIDRISDTWGINIMRAEVKNFDFSHGLNHSIDSVPRSINDAEALREKSKGERDATTNLAEGQRQKRRLEATGDGEGVKAYMKKTGLTAQEAQAAEVARALAAGGNVVVVGGGGMADLMGIVEATSRRHRPGGGRDNPGAHAPQPAQQP